MVLLLIFFLGRTGIPLVFSMSRCFFIFSLVFAWCACFSLPAFYLPAGEPLYWNVLACISGFVVLSFMSFALWHPASLDCGTALGAMFSGIMRYLALFGDSPNLMVKKSV
jgi:hypothetical protein